MVRTLVGLGLAAPTVAAAGPPEADLSAWLARTTDLNSAQVALVSADSVYTLEPLGAPLPTGEIIVLVRTEPRADVWGATHGFQSWDANLLIDCARRSMRVIRSATYPQRNRGGRPTPEPLDNDARTPGKSEPAARLLAAACDRDFAWPLRGQTATRLMLMSALDRTPGPVAAAAPAAGAKPEPATLHLPETITLAKASPAPVPSPTAPAPHVAAASGAPAETALPTAPQARRWVVQVARGVSVEGADRARGAAMKALGSDAGGLKSWTQLVTTFGDQPVHAALLGDFSSYVAADAACQTLRRARQDCQVRIAPDAYAPAAVAAIAAAPAAKAPAPTASAAAAPPSPPAAAPPAAIAGATYAVQVARGPSEDGARWALARARKVLGPLAAGLTDAMPVSRIPGDHLRYDVRLEGFSSAEAAAEACLKLTAAGQNCFRPAPAADAQAAAETRSSPVG